ncbi:MAG: hypothetical protein M1812_001959 [Candelaria pacifica]|nr:MAG: hypothetical protein M1812_001959 [Candelaria pacifica]
MATPALSARLRHLNDSAYLLATTSPATSSYMMSQYNKVALDHYLTLPEARRREVCGACGNIMISGWSGHASLEKLGRPIVGNPIRSSSKETPTGMIMIYECHICNRKTRQLFKKRNNVRQRQRRKSTLQSVPPPPSDGSAAITIATSQQVPPSIKQSPVNNGSRRRAKARKQSGLQAMLARTKATNTTGGCSENFGLDLMDLLKST